MRLQLSLLGVGQLCRDMLHGDDENHLWAFAVLAVLSSAGYRPERAIPGVLAVAHAVEIHLTLGWRCHEASAQNL